MEDAIVEVAEANQRSGIIGLAATVELEGCQPQSSLEAQTSPLRYESRCMRFDNADGEPIVVLVNFTGHPTSVPGETLKFSADYVGAMKDVRGRVGWCCYFHAGCIGRFWSINKGPDSDHVIYGQALGSEVVSVPQTLQPVEVAKPSLKVREERFQFASRSNFNNPLVRGAYSVAFFPELIANFVDEYTDGIRPRLTVAVLNGELASSAALGFFALMPFG
ncbi:MAG: hypothetical protein R3C56_00655 [Pirellulaceae bacterium]